MVMDLRINVQFILHDRAERINWGSYSYSIRDPAWFLVPYIESYGSLWKPYEKPSLVWGTAWAPQNCRSGRRWSKVLFLFFDLVTLSWVEILWVLFSHRVQNQELI